MIDVERVRADTPGVERVIHLNNAGSALPPRPVHDAMVRHLELELAIGGYEAAAAAKAAVDRPYAAVAELLNAKPHEIAMVENATRGWDMAFYAFRFQPGDRILTTHAEYSSNYIAYLQAHQRWGVEVHVIPPDGDGALDVEALERMVDERVKLISITHVPTNGGLVNPAAAVGRIAKRHGIPFLLDACQSAGQMPLDVEEIGCDMLSATARKFLRGPRGFGFLYVRDSWIKRLEPPLLDLHAATWTAPDRYDIVDDARRFENWERNYAAQIGMGVAVDYALALGLPAIAERVCSLAEELRQRLAAIPGVTVRDLGRQRCGIVTFTHDRLTPEEIKTALAAHRIQVSVSTITSTRLDMSARDLRALVRASPHYYTTSDELALTAEVLRTL
ncbi:MAG: aminotransferase class V-fold PLP-dependent enzyme [Alphaproteobacteria bacterium]|nr:MAG: aminotransferase class V-fold PLP-dependent enzyme [Alphaproteobacteria bacterium]